MKKGNTSRKKYSKTFSDYLYYPIRIAVLLSVIFIFIPALNPARVSGMINKNLSLFTSGVSYSTLTDGFGRAFNKGWVSEASFRLLSAAALITCIGIVITALSACMTLGNIKMKKVSNVCIALGSLIELAGLALIFKVYQIFEASERIDKIEPMFPGTYWPVVILSAFLFLCTLLQILLFTKKKSEAKFEMETRFRLFLMLMPFIALAGLFSYLPLWGWRYAFFDYKAGDTLSMANFVGFKWFTQLVKNPATVKDIVRVMKNTLGMSFLGISTSWLPMAFAIFLCEMRNLRFRRFVQTFTTVPNFISWVLVYAIGFCIFSTDGFISSMMIQLGFWTSGKNMLMSGANTWLKMWAWGTWKGLGWSAIIYIASISGIDQQLYEAATVDGAGRFAKMWHITVPSLLSTFFVLLLMSVANILSNGMDQYLVFKNATNADAIRVLDLYVYEMGIGQGTIPLTTVVSMLKSVISVTLLFAANNISKLLRGESIV